MERHTKEKAQDATTALLLGALAGFGVYWYVSGDSDRKEKVHKFVGRYMPFLAPFLGSFGNKMLGR